MEIYNSVVDMIGQTPMVKLRRLVPVGSADVYVKLERFNPSGSVKDRAAYNLIHTAEEQGLLQPGAPLSSRRAGIPASAWR